MNINNNKYYLIGWIAMMACGIVMSGLAHGLSDQLPPMNELLPAEILKDLDTSDTLTVIAAVPNETSIMEFEAPGMSSMIPSNRDGVEISGRVSNLYYDSSLREVLSDFAAQTGRMIIPDQSVQGMISCELNDVPLIEALNVVLSVGDFDFKEMDGYILVGSTSPDSPSYTRLCQSKIVKLSYLSAEEAIDLLPVAIRKYANASKTNVVSVMAPNRTLERIVESLHEYDQAPKQFLLDARIVVIEMGNLFDMGVQWDWPTVEAGTYSNSDLHGMAAPAAAAQWPWGLQIGYTPDKEFTNNLMMSLNLLTLNDEATVTANPQVMAQEGEQSSIKVTTEEYFEILTRGYYTNSELEKITAGTSLEITPHLGNGEEITLNITTEVSDVVARGGNDLPVVTRREASSTVRIHDGGTAVIGGLTDNRTRTANERVPYLGRIPIIGRLFRNDAQDINTRQIAIFLTAHLLKERKGENVSPESLKLPSYIPVSPKEFKIRLKDQLKIK